MAGLRERGKPAWTRSAATTASPFGQGQGQGHGLGHEKTARPQADGRLQGKTSLSPAQENLHPGRSGGHDSYFLTTSVSISAPKVRSVFFAPQPLSLIPLE